MHRKKLKDRKKLLYVTLILGAILFFGGLITHRYITVKHTNIQVENKRVSHSIGNFKTEDSELLIACWVRQNADMGYDTNGHFISPADVPLDKIEVSLTAKGYDVRSNYFVNSQLSERNNKIVYHVISVSNGRYWELIFPNSKEKVRITKENLIEHYSASIK